jgi:hypothetical protein
MSKLSQNVWMVDNLNPNSRDPDDDGADEGFDISVYDSLLDADQEARRIAGCSRSSLATSDYLVYRGHDGAISVLVHRVPREVASAQWPELAIPTVDYPVTEEDLALIRKRTCKRVQRQIAAINLQTTAIVQLRDKVMALAVLAMLAGEPDPIRRPPVKGARVQFAYLIARGPNKGRFAAVFKCPQPGGYQLVTGPERSFSGGSGLKLDHRTVYGNYTTLAAAMDGLEALFADQLSDHLRQLLATDCATLRS